MPQPTKQCVVHVLGEDGKIKAVIRNAVFPEVPQIGWTLILDRMTTTLTDIAGIVTKIVMFDSSQEIIVYLKETKE